MNKKIAMLAGRLAAAEFSKDKIIEQLEYLDIKLERMYREIEDIEGQIEILEEEEIYNQAEN